MSPKEQNTPEQNTPGASDETKRKFREALARKQKSTAKGEANLDGKGQAQRSQGPATHQREFRRKSV